METEHQTNKYKRRFFIFFIVIFSHINLYSQDNYIVDTLRPLIIDSYFNSGLRSKWHF